MRAFLRQFTGAIALVAIAVAIGVGTGIAATGNESWYSTGAGATAVVGGNLIVKPGPQGTSEANEPGDLTVSGTIALSGGASTTDDLLIFRDVFGVAGNDLLYFRAGHESLVFGQSPENYDASIWFEQSNPFTENDDGIWYTAGSSADDDSLLIAADDLILESNNGDVVIRLGN